MKIGLRIVTAVVALVVVSAPASAKSRKSSPQSSAVGECFKQYGGHYHRKTKRWHFQTREGQMGSWMDAVNNCVAQKTGRSGNYVKTYRPTRNQF